MYERFDVPSEFKYPENGLLHLRGMLTAEQVNNPNRLNLLGERIRRVLKRGFTTQVTVGTLTRLRSFVRKYSTAGNMESLELPILLHENETGTFSKGGDSGSLIVSVLGGFVGLLIGGSNSGTNGSDITLPLSSSGSGSSCAPSSPVQTCTFRPSSPTWPRFFSFFRLYPIIPVTNDLCVKEKEGLLIYLERSRSIAPSTQGGHIEFGLGQTKLMDAAVTMRTVTLTL